MFHFIIVVVSVLPFCIWPLSPVYHTEAALLSGLSFISVFSCCFDLLTRRISKIHD